MKKNEQQIELEILREKLIQTRGYIRLFSYGLVVDLVGLGITTNNYVNEKNNILPVIMFATITTYSVYKELHYFNEELKIRREINEKEKKLSLNK